MPILALRNDPLATDVTFGDSVMRVALADGRELSVPLEWFPRLRDASPALRQNWRLIGHGEGINWPDLDDDVSVGALLGLPT